MKPAPAVPEDAERRIARGGVALKEAKSSADYQSAAQEFEQAALAAPWLADAYYQAGMARSKAEDYAGAASAFKLYLLAAPTAKNAKDVKTLMYEMEYKGEKAGKEKAAQQAAADKIRQAELVLQPLKGSWHGRNCQVGEDYFGGCTDEQRKGTNWYRFEGSDGPFRYSFTFPGDGTVQLNAYESWAECKTGSVWGVATGASSLADVRWEHRPDSGPARQVFSQINTDGTYLQISCDRPLSGANPDVKYHYVYWYRP
jgi:tetratricopeptide (TPR) repeat protein